MIFGYACINMSLSGLPKSKRITTNRSMIKRTFKQKGIDYASELGLLNSQDLSGGRNLTMSLVLTGFPLSTEIMTLQ